MRFPLSLAIVGTVLAVSLAAGLIVGCGGSDSQSNSPTGDLATANSPLGTILVDRSGRTLYLFEKDRPGESACSGACAIEWPPVIANGRSTVAGAARASLIGTTRRSDGGRQLTYAGRPLYRFTGDTRPGQTNGQGLLDFGARWSAVSAAGAQASTSRSSASRY